MPGTEHVDNEERLMQIATKNTYRYIQNIIVDMILYDKATDSRKFNINMT